jgi:hypothetical protein
MRKPRDGVSNQITMATSSTVKDDHSQESPLCHRMDCLLQVVVKCTECSFYYCHEHIQTHPHPREKLEILR